MPNAPSIPGLSFRRYRGRSDFGIMADIVQQSRDADLYDVVETPEDIAAEFASPQNFNPGEDMIFVEVGRKTVGFTRSMQRTAADRCIVYEQQVHLVPSCRVRGLRRALLRWSENRVRERAREMPRDVKKSVEVAVSYTPNDLRSLVEEEGYRPARYTYLMLRADLDEVQPLPLPEGVEVRPVQPEDQIVVWRAARSAFRDDRFYDEETWTDESFRQLATTGHYFEPDLWVVAWAGGDVVGGVFPWVDRVENAAYGRNWGYTQAIFTRKDWRNRGIASALVTRAIRALRIRGVTEAALTVDTENPSGALRLYEELGYRVHAQYARFRKPLD